MRLLILFCCGLLLFSSCTSSKNIASSEDQKNVLQQTLNENTSFEIVSTWAFPTNARITLANSALFPVEDNTNGVKLMEVPNFLRKQGDSIVAVLPFFGVHQMHNGHASDTEIAFKDVPSKFKMEYNEKKDRYKIYFRMRDKQEFFHVTIYVYANLSADITVDSNHRSIINYRGKVRAI
jgi:hypothetical protein